MPDYDALLSRSRNALLGPQQLTTREAIRAGIQSTTGTPYAQNRANIMAEKYDRALRGYGILSNERDFEAGQEQRQFDRGMREREFSSAEEQREFRRDMAERQFEAAEAQRMWTRAQAEAEQGDENVQQLLELSEAYGANPAEAQSLAAAVIQRTEAENIEDSAALPGLVAEEAEKLGLQARPELTLMNTAGGGVAGIDPMGEARTIVEGQSEPPKRYTDIAQLNSDLDNGYITPAQAMRDAQALYADDSETWQPMTPDQRSAYGIPEGQPAQISSTGKAATIGGSQGITLYGPDGKPTATIGGNLPLTESHRSGMARDSSETLRKIQSNLSEMETAFRNLQEGGPDAVGASGVITRNVGAVANQIANFFNQGDWVDTADAQRVKTSVGVLFARYLPTVTGEESRYTESDVGRAAAVMPASGNASDIVNQSFGNIIIAMETIGDIERRAEIREEMKLAGHPEWMDLTYESGRMQAVDRLKRQGMSGDEAIDEVFRLVDEFNIPLDVRGMPVRGR